MNSPGWRPDEPGQVQEWCPNCKHFRKVHGLNDCAIREISSSAARWQRSVQHKVTSRIDPQAHGCPGFVPFKALQARLIEQKEYWAT